MKNVDITIRQEGDEARVCFIHPYTPEFHRACQALQIRDLLLFGANPIPIPGENFNAWFADIEKLDGETYAKYSMLVRDFYSEEIRGKFDALFKSIDVHLIPRSIINPNFYMQAQTEKVDALIEKYKDTSSPLVFYDSKHQAEGVILLMNAYKSLDFSGAINNDAPGMGKSRQSIIAAKELGLKKILVIAPKSARVITWPRQVGLVCGDKVQFIDNKNYITDANWDLIQWDRLRDMPDDFFENLSRYELVIADEFHKVANEGSQRSVAFERIARVVKKIFGLTGTAVRKRPRNILNLLKLMNHPLVRGEKNEQRFIFRYCASQKADGTWDFNQAKELDELHDLLKDCLIRREKDQTNLPPKTRIVRKVFMSETDQDKYYRAFKEYTDNHPESARKMKAMKENYPWGAVKKSVDLQKAAELKLKSVWEWAEELLDDGEKVVIGTGITASWEKHMEHFKSFGAVGIHGGDSDKKRLDAQRKFQEDPRTRVFVGNIIAAGESIDLWAASNLGFSDITYVPVEMLQFEDRISRGGQTKPCAVNYFVLAGTKDEDHFIDFVKSKDVVESITNRRDGYGNIIRDALWAGDLEGLVEIL